MGRTVMDKDEMTQLVHEVIDDLNELLPADEALDKAPETVILGEGGKLDSMGIINLVVALDGKLAGKCGRDVSLTDDPEIFSKDGVLSTVDTMTAYLLEVVRV